MGGTAHSDTCADAALTPALDIDQLFRGYARYVSAIGLRLLGRRDEVDDLVQDVFMAAMGGIAGVRGGFGDNRSR